MAESKKIEQYNEQKSIIEGATHTLKQSVIFDFNNAQAVIRRVEDKELEPYIKELNALKARFLEDLNNTKLRFIQNELYVPR